MHTHSGVNSHVYKGDAGFKNRWASCLPCCFVLQSSRTAWLFNYCWLYLLWLCGFTPYLLFNCLPIVERVDYLPACHYNSTVKLLPNQSAWLYTCLPFYTLSVCLLLSPPLHPHLVPTVINPALVAGSSCYRLICLSIQLVFPAAVWCPLKSSRLSTPVTRPLRSSSQSSYFVSRKETLTLLLHCFLTTAVHTSRGHRGRAVWENILNCEAHPQSMW